MVTSLTFYKNNILCVKIIGSICLCIVWSLKERLVMSSDNVRHCHYFAFAFLGLFLITSITIITLDDRIRH